MSSGPVILAVIGPLVLLLCAGLAELGARGSLTRNSAVGIRTPATRASDEAWRTAHAAARRPALASAAIAVVGGAITVLVPPTPGWITTVSVGYSLLLAALIAWVALAAEWAARSVDVDDGRGA